jgi:3-hexulose-6-phosphate synthase/6-phospho-3-hexuloisomerase
MNRNTTKTGKFDMVRIDLDHLQFPVVQVSLDLTSIGEALAAAVVAVEAGVGWLEAGTPRLLAEGTHAVRALRERFPKYLRPQ